MNILGNAGKVSQKSGKNGRYKKVRITEIKNEIRNTAETLDPGQLC